jgi:ATP-dependent Clp protease ATP-binding subunit ClpC
MDTATFAFLGLPLAFAVVGIAWYIRQRSSQARTTVLSLYSRDLTELARQGKLDPVIGRDHEIQRVIQILARRTKNNPVIIGESGVGKTAIVEQLANDIASGRVPSTLAHKRILQLDLSGLVAGTKYRGEFEKRLKHIVNEIIAAQQQIVIFIDELHIIAEAGEATGAIDAADILKPALARGQLQAIGATTAEEYRKYIERDATLERRFQPVIIEEPDANATKEMLKGIRKQYENHHQVEITDEAIDTAVRLAEKFLVDRHFPDKAIDLVDEAAAKVRLEMIMHPENYKGRPRPQVLQKDIEEIVSDWTNDLVRIEREKTVVEAMKHPESKPIQ